MATLTMYDSVDITTVPINPEAVAGYVGGHWPTYLPLVVQFPGAHHVSIAVNAGERARCLDVEPGDATNAQAPGWFHSNADRSQGKPILYTYASNGQALVNTMSAAGIARSEYWLWLAHFTGTPHICGPHDGFAQADLTQWTDRALGRNLDASLVPEEIFGIKPDPRKNPTGTATSDGAFHTETGRWEIKGTAGDFKTGTKGGKAAAYISFDETNGHWAVQVAPWARKPKGVFGAGKTPRQQPSGTAGFKLSFNADNGHWTIRGSAGDFQPGTKGGIAAAYVTFDETNGHWYVEGKPWKRTPLRAILDFFGL